MNAADTKRDSEITMMATSNSLEREDDWKTLLKSADPNFSLEEVRRTPGAKLDMIVARWK
jgi:hypothetical protein